eukprot:scaffold4752_cov113-Cylindrotheca_fusiformis.AAC.1
MTEAQREEAKNSTNSPSAECHCNQYTGPRILHQIVRNPQVPVLVWAVDIIYQTLTVTECHSNQYTGSRLRDHYNAKSPTAGPCLGRRMRSFDDWRRHETL